MEELKILVSMVASLPQMALWVVVLFFIYKISIIGSIYGIIRYITSKLHDWAITKKTQPTTTIKERGDIRSMVIVNDGTYDDLISLVNSIKPLGSTYVHHKDVEWLRSAVLEKKASEQLKTHKV